MGPSLLLFQKESGLGPFPVTTGLGESAEQVTGNPLPEAQPRCSGLATGLAAHCIHLAAVCIPSPSSWLPARACDGSRAWGGSQPQILKKKKADNQRHLPSWGTQERLQLSLCSTYPGYSYSFPLAKFCSAMRTHRGRFTGLKKYFR